jgi:hypothetical protein
MVSDWSSLQEDSSRGSYAPHSHHSWEDFSTTCFCQCLILARVDEYSCATKAFQPMTPTIPLKDTIVAMFQLHTPILDLVPPPIFYY